MQITPRFAHRRIAMVAAAALLACLAAGGCKKKEAPQQEAQPPAPGAPPAAMSGPMGDEQKLAMGRAIFNKQCASCHGEEGKGAGSQPGPSLAKADFKYGRTPEAIKESIVKGRPGGMPAFGNLQEIEVETIVAYVLSLKK